MLLKIHKISLNCGENRINLTNNNDDVTCKKCLKLIKDAKPSLTYEEEVQLKKDEAIKRADEFNSIYPIGTKVLFQGDGKDTTIITTTRSEAIVYADYLTIFLDGVSGSYLLDDRFVRVLTDENKDLQRLR